MYVYIIFLFIYAACLQWLSCLEIAALKMVKNGQPNTIERIGIGTQNEDSAWWEVDGDAF